MKKEVIKAANNINNNYRIPTAHRLLYEHNYKDCIELANATQISATEIISKLSDIQAAFFKEFDELASKLISNTSNNSDDQ